MWRAFTKKTQIVIDRTANHWDDIAWFAVWRPMNWLIALMGGSMALRVVAESEDLLMYQITCQYWCRKIAILLSE